MTANTTDYRINADSSARAALMVADSSRILKRFYFVQRELVLMAAGWLPGTEHWQSKLLLPEFLWQDALIAGELRARVLELRFPEREIDMIPDEGLFRLWRHFRDAPDGFAFVEGLRRVVKPMLLDAYRAYLKATDALDDAPTLRILRAAVGDIEEQLSRWEDAVADAQHSYPDEMASTRQWVEGAAALAQQIGSIFDTGPLTQTSFDPAAHGGKPFAIARLGVRDKRFDPVRFGWPDSLTPSVGPGEGLQLQIRQGVHHLNEVWAAEMAGACLFDLADDADAEFLADAARWCFDEIRHCRMGFTRLREWGFTMDQMPLGSYSYDAGASVDALTRLGIIFYFESTYIGTKSKRMRYFGSFGDTVSSHDMDIDWADEQIHAHYGTRWLNYFLEKRNDPRRPTDFRDQAEAAVEQMRRNATPQDHEKVAAAFERMMSLARQRAARIAPD